MINNIRKFFISREKIRNNLKVENIQNQNEIIINENNDFLFSKFNNFEKRNIIKKWEKLSNKNEVVVSFVSDPKGSTFYSDKINSLVNTIDSLGYDYRIIHYESDRNYFQNCCYKPVFIRDVLNEMGKNLIWIDGDTNLKKSIDHFIVNDKEFDIGLVTYNSSITGFLASPLFLKNTETTMNLVNDWANHCKTQIESGNCELDHDALKHTILPKYTDKLRICLNWDPQNNLHNGSVLENVDSKVPSKSEIIKRITEINRSRPFLLTNNDFKIV